MIDLKTIKIGALPSDVLKAQQDKIKGAAQQGMDTLVALCVEVLSDKTLDLSTKASFMLMASRLGNDYPPAYALCTLFARRMVTASESMEPEALEIFNALRPGMATSMVNQMLRVTVGQMYGVAESYNTVMDFHHLGPTGSHSEEDQAPHVVH